MKHLREQLHIETLSDYCHSRLAAYYPAGVPDFARERLEKELACVGMSQATEYFLFYHALNQAAERSGHILHTPGAENGSLLTFLLGQSCINPLPAHYYCPECGWSDVSECVKFGLDLEMRHCPKCGTAASRDGFRIADEMFWTPDIKRRGPTFSFRCSNGFAAFALETTRKFFEPQGRAVLPLGAIISDDTNLLQQIGAAVLPQGKSLCDFPQFAAFLSDGRPCICGEFWRLIDSGIKRVIISESLIATSLQKAQVASGILVEDMLDTLPGVTVRDITNTGLVTDKECIALQESTLSYYDMACALTLPHNTYTEDCFALLETPEFQAFPLHMRDDAFDELVSLGFGADEAARAATFIRSGQAQRKPEQMDEMNLPQHVKDTARHCIFLYSRGSGAQWLVSLMLLARYMQHDPVAYFAAVHS